MEADFEMTAAAMGKPQGDERLFVEFFIHPHQNQKRSQEEGRPIYDDREYVRIIVPGDKDNIVERPAYDDDRQRFPRQYRAFKNKEDQTMASGTPLSVWPLLTRAQVAELSHFGIKTVEQLAEVNDAHAQKFMGILMLRQKAKDFLEASKDSAYLSQLRAELEERDSKIEVLTQAVESLKEKVASLEE